MNLVEVVIINWKRPANVSLIVDAFKNQTVKCTVTIIDCHTNNEYQLSKRTLEKVDRAYRLTENFGAYSRYIYSAAYDHEFTFFADDDMIPGSKCIEYYLRYSTTNFGVLAQVGRRIGMNGIYEQYFIEPSNELQAIDIAIRGFFVRTRNLGYVQLMKWKLGYQNKHDTEDDIILCCAMTLLAKLPVLLLPKLEEDGLMNMEELPTPHALSWRDNHIERRTEHFQKAIALGWKPALFS